MSLVSYSFLQLYSISSAHSRLKRFFTDGHLSCRLLDPKHYLLPLLGSLFHLETAVGMNGRVWVNTKSPKHTIAFARCIEAADPDGGSKDSDAIKKLLSTFDLSV